MLRVAKDCGLGDLSLTSDILDSCLPLDRRTGLPIKPRLPPPTKPSSTPSSSDLLAENSSSGQEMELLSEQEKQLVLGNNVVEMPNLLTKRPNIAHIVALAPEDTKEN